MASSSVAESFVRKKRTSSGRGIGALDSGEVFALMLEAASDEPKPVEAPHEAPEVEPPHQPPPADESGLALWAEIQVSWAERLSRHGRCSEALQYFTRAYESEASPTLRARALYGRMVCFALTGDFVSSHGDLDAYLYEFPNARHAERLRRKHAH
jgi:hypothetical protein